MTRTMIMLAGMALALASTAEARWRPVGSVTQTRSFVTPRGPATQVTSRSWNRWTGTRDQTRIYTSPAGRTRISDFDSQRIGRGQWAVSRSVTGFGGNTRTRSGILTRGW